MTSVERGHKSKTPEHAIVADPPRNYLMLVTVAIGWVLWFISLSVAPLMLFAFDGPVPVAEGATLGALQATWIVGIPIGLLWAPHLITNGWHIPTWRARWVVCAIGVALW